MKVTDWRARTVLTSGFRLFGAIGERVCATRGAGLEPAGLFFASDRSTSDTPGAAERG